MSDDRDTSSLSADEQGLLDRIRFDREVLLLVKAHNFDSFHQLTV